MANKPAMMLQDNHGAAQKVILMVLEKCFENSLAVRSHEPEFCKLSLNNQSLKQALRLRWANDKFNCEYNRDLVLLLVQLCFAYLFIYYLFFFGV